MGERKVMNKWFPPDFDPTRLPKASRAAVRKVRMMMPMSVQCASCGEYVYHGKKFNAAIEPTREEYLGIKIWRLTVRCPRCSGAISIKTDPANCDYTCDSGAVRNFEPWRAFNAEQAEKDIEREEARKDVMKDLEAKQYDAQREMDQLNQLDELRTINAKRSTLTPDDLLKGILDGDHPEIETIDAYKEDDNIEVEHFKRMQEQKRGEGKRKTEAAFSTQPPPAAAASSTPSETATGSVPSPLAVAGGTLVLKKRRKVEKKLPVDAATSKHSGPVAATRSGPLGLVSYGSDDGET
eukprot:NODE_2461_length_1196_cov_23.952049_g2246_i0.p1 GENE.NODE_2461_length_1196_cov_23.952049_g2246_i0~~NODE_2461_length_1196_cov_23.952049_g2246_i0.p1  ORF type:complete len:295 (-),score=68.54 NODE_2461_length_1196_cov_23.952049_g2246_i0:160-1044(-)